MRTKSWAIVAVVVAANLLFWSASNRPQSEVEWSGLINGVSFSPFRRDDSPLEEVFPTEQEIEQDLLHMSEHVKEVRVYSSAMGQEAVPRLAQRHNLRVTAGAWLDRDHEKNAREVTGLIKNAHVYPNVSRLIVGNETILRGDLTVAQLAGYIDEVRRKTTLPISSAEPWHVWIEHPELADHVDFIATHLLPYWEGVDVQDAVGFVMDKYMTLKRTFPDKPILIAEVGWPSNGNRVKHALASQSNQTRFLRQFLTVARDQNLDYFIMEAFDQPWKTEFEGSVGAYWGMFDVDRRQKVAFTGPIVDNPTWYVEAAVATALALLPMLWLFSTWRSIRSRGRLIYALLLQTCASAFTITLALPATHDFSILGTMVWFVLLPAQIALYAVVLINGFELVEMSWRQSLRRRFDSTAHYLPAHTPKVSLHLAICNEPPHLVIQTLNSLAALDYPNFEVVVVDNNTKDPAVWRPVARHCASLGARFKFFSLGAWPGFKAGALNFALTRTADDAEIVGVVDSDYLVRPDWLRSLVPHFANPKVGFVQAPQDHRDWHDDKFKEMCNWEYAGFFHIGMVHRNERDAIIQHGTMTLIRKSALASLSGWSEQGICEDAELGLRLLANGYESVYVNEPFGRGLTPHSFASYKGQRFRWAYGAVQIIKQHWRRLIGLEKSRLTAGQRYHFLAGWFPWFGDAMLVVFAYMAVLWSLGLVLLPKYFEFPLWAFVLPTLALFGYKIATSLWLYRRCVPCTGRQSVGAAIAGMGLTHVIGYAMIQGLFTDNKPFLRTPKSENKPALWRGFAMAREELTLLLALAVSAIGVLRVYGTDHYEALIWLAVLAIQAMPYLAALYCSFMNVLSSREPVFTPAPANSSSVSRRAPLGGSVLATADSEGVATSHHKEAA